MNIVEAYVKEYEYFYVMFTSIDYELLKDVVYNSAKEFNAQFIDAYPIMENVEDIDNQRFKELLSGKNRVKFIIAPVFPSRFTKIKVSFHINLSLNNTLISSKNIRNNLVELEIKYKNDTHSIIHKYFNISKYEGKIQELENDIFETIITRINKKLDDGNYQDKIKAQSLKNNNDEFKYEKRVSKRYDHDKKEEYLEEKNKKIDEEILNNIEDSETDDSPREKNYVKTDDVNMDDELDEDGDNILIPTKDYSDEDILDVYRQAGGIGKVNNKNGIITGIRMIKNEYGISGNRTLKKKMKNKVA